MWRFLSRLFGPAPAEPVAPISLAPAPTAPATERRPQTIFRATSAFMADMRRDLSRRHAFAHERVGFITVRAASGADGLVLLADKYHPVADDEYEEDDTVGAMIGQEALRKALNLALLQGVGVFHVHMHLPSPRLWFSGIDLREQNKFVPDFFKVCPQMPHGAIVLNDKAAAGRVWVGPAQVSNIDEFNIVGARTTVTRAARDGSTDFYT
jgi:hypothetical protein